MTGPFVVLGDVLLDRDLTGTVERVMPDAPAPVMAQTSDDARPGGAGLAAVLAARDGREVVLVTALSEDAAGAELRGLLAAAGVRVVDLGLAGATPEKVRMRSAGQSLLRLDRGGQARTPGPLTDEAREVLSDACTVLVADYGRGLTARADVRQALLTISATRTPLVWDPHPRGPEPVHGCTLVTPNAVEAAHFAPGHDGALLTVTTARARELAVRWRATAVTVTLSGRGALLVSGDGAPSVLPAPPVTCLDPCGAGDRFASAAAGVLADGGLPSEAVTAAVGAASTFVAAGGASAVLRRADPATLAAELTGAAERVCASGGTVVATGGCFDLLHPGHVSVLQQARRLGDCLVVLLNSDDSVRRLKGPGRPLQPQQDRATLLRALACVDQVIVFDEDTPTAALRDLRPDVWVKGGDYALGDLPEAAALSEWGGQAVVLPYVPGRSTTTLIAHARTREVLPHA